MGNDHEIRWQAKRDAFLMGIACESKRLAESSEPKVIAISATKIEELSRSLRYAAEEVVRERARVEEASRAKLEATGSFATAFPPKGAA